MKLPVMRPRSLASSEAMNLVAATDYQEGAIVSRTILRASGGSLTLFAFDAGQELSEHAAPFDAVIQVLDGRGLVTIGGRPVEVAAGEAVHLPADIPHAVKATERFKMLLVMLRASGGERPPA